MCQAQTFSPNFVSLNLNQLVLLHVGAEESSENVWLLLAALMFSDTLCVD